MVPGNRDCGSLVDVGDAWSGWKYWPNEYNSRRRCGGGLVVGTCCEG